MCEISTGMIEVCINGEERYGGQGFRTASKLLPCTVTFFREVKFLSLGSPAGSPQSPAADSAPRQEGPQSSYTRD